jgi:hypothetical protein
MGNSKGRYLGGIAAIFFCLAIYYEKCYSDIVSDIPFKEVWLVWHIYILVRGCKASEKYESQLGL